MPSRINLLLTAAMLVVAAYVGQAAAQPPAPSADDYPNAPAETPDVVSPHVDGCVGGGCDRRSCDGCGGDCRHSRRGWLRRFLRGDCLHEDDGCYCVPPLGSSVNAFMEIQISKGDAAQMVLYDYDFEPGESRLNCRGMVQLDKYARAMMYNSHVLIIEAYPLDQHVRCGTENCLEDFVKARRQCVVEALRDLGHQVSPERVVLSMPPTRPLDGEAAIYVNEARRRIQQSGRYTPVGGSGGSPLNIGFGAPGIP